MPGRGGKALVLAAVLVTIGSVLFFVDRQAFVTQSSQGVSDVNGDGKIVVLCFGDSVTRGSSRGTYPAWLRKYLGPSVQVANEGMYGEWTGGGVNRLPDLLGRLHPDYVIVLEGVNDAIHEGCQNIDTIGNNLRNMVDQIRRAKAVPYVGTVFAAPSVIGDAGESCLDRINQIIDQIPAAKIDFARRIRDHWDELLLDGLHPNNRGCEMLAAEALGALLPSPGGAPTRAP